MPIINKLRAHTVNIHVEPTETVQAGNRVLADFLSGPSRLSQERLAAPHVLGEFYRKPAGRTASRLKVCWTSGLLAGLGWMK